jgi:hypothetical protein
MDELERQRTRQPVRNGQVVEHCEASPVKRKASNALCFYLPRRFRRWYVLAPAYLVVCVCLFVATVLVAASFIHSEQFFRTDAMAPDARMQLARVAEVIWRADRTGQLDIYSGYSTFAGTHAEWNPIFYMFASMSLVEILETFPEYEDEAAGLLTSCARGVVRMPPDVSSNRIASYLAAHDYTTSPITAGYVGVVLGLRKTIIQDTLFDAALVPAAESLAAHLSSSCEHCTAEWTSDQATQLYAVWLYDQSFARDHSALFKRWLDVMKKRFVEDRTGLLCSFISVNPDAKLSEPRGTSIAWAAIFLADVMPEFAREQYAALCQYRECRFFNLAATSEYARGNVFQAGDLDSGPLVLGISPAATGFTLCAHKLYGSPAAFSRTFRVLELLGAPKEVNHRKYYRRGNAMGDAVLLYAKVAQPRPPH